MIKDAESLKERQQNIAKIEEAIELEREKILKEQEIQKEERAQLAREKIFIEKEKATAVIDMQEMINELNLEDEEVLEQEKEKINTPPIIYAEEMLSDSEDDYCIVSLTGDT